MSARIEYGPGEAWCVAAGTAVLVCERDLDAARARELYERLRDVASADGLQELVDGEATALLAVVDLDGTRVLLRRHGVPATVDGEALPVRFGDAWERDEMTADATLAAGGLAALELGTLPLEGGVARVAAVRVAPASVADAPESDGPVLGSFGETLPPAAAAQAAEPAPIEAEPVEPEPVEPELSEPASNEPEPTEPAPTDALAEEPAVITDEEPVVEPEPAPQPEPMAPLGGLIDSVPGFIKPAVDIHPVVDSPEPEPEPEPARDAVAPEPTSTPTGDHDGMTITADEARRLAAKREAARAATPAEPAGTPATGPLVLSTLCPNGHVNEPGTTSCTTCGTEIDDASAAQRRRPEIAVVVLPGGDRVPLGRGVVLGRRPRSRRVEDGRVPRLVTVDSPGEDISRSHLELRVEDWNLVAVDLSSTNGTLLLREGASPQRLRPEASTILQLGDRLDLGDGVVVTIESAP